MITKHNPINILAKDDKSQRNLFTGCKRGPSTNKQYISYDISSNYFL